MQNKLEIGHELAIGNHIYKVLYIDDINTYLIKINISKIEIITYSNDSINTILNLLEPISPKSHQIVELEKLTDNKKQRFQTALNIIKEIETEYGPTYIRLQDKLKSGYIRLISDKYGVSVKTVWKYIRRYLQSGFDINSLMDLRTFNRNHMIGQYKTGPKRTNTSISSIPFDTKVQLQADTIIKRFKNSKQMTIRAAYQDFINMFYSEYNTENNQYEWLPQDQRPSFRQFSYYLSKKLSKKELDEIKTSKLEVINDKRVLTGSSRTNALRPGWVVECDAVEVDLSLVSDFDNQQTIGRPIMYLMVDVLTSCILAVSVSHENNSIIGLTNLFVNLCDDKEDLCRRYGLIIDPKTWPSNVIPHEIRCDRGSDFVSLKFKEICRDYNITLNYEAPGVGSLKGIVEQTFHQFHASMKPKLENFGYITKRHDSKHHEHAMLTLTSFMKLVVNYVIYHNMHVIKDYPLNKDMLKDPNFSAAPYLLWQYYAAKTGVTYQINSTNRKNYLYNLLLPANAKISRRGVEYKKLFYTNNDENLSKRMYECENKSKSFSIKYDPRTTNKLYYSENGIIKELMLNESILHNQDFKNMTWHEYDDYLRRKKQLRNQHEDDFLELNSQLRTNFDYIIEEAKTDLLPSTKELRKNRKEEKFMHNKSNQLELSNDKEIEYEYLLDDFNDPKFLDDEQADSEKYYEEDDEFNDALASLLEMMKG